MTDALESIHPYDPACASLFVRVEHLARYRYAAQFAAKRKLRRALDCACGTGYGSLLLSSAMEQVTGLDANKRLLEQSRADAALQGLQNISFLQSDLNAGLPMMEAGGCDLVTCFETLEHIRQEEQLLDEFFRVLRRGGWLLLSVPKAGYEPVDPSGRPENPFHLRLYEQAGLRELLSRHGFAVEKVLGQPYANILRANMESWRRDSGATPGQIQGFFEESPLALECYCKLWGWPTEEAPEHSNVLMMVCRRLRND